MQSQESNVLVNDSDNSHETMCWHKINVNLISTQQTIHLSINCMQCGQYVVVIYVDRNVCIILHKPTLADMQAHSFIHVKFTKELETCSSLLSEWQGMFSSIWGCQHAGAMHIYVFYRHNNYGSKASSSLKDILLPVSGYWEVNTVKFYKLRYCKQYACICHWVYQQWLDTYSEYWT